MGGDSSAVDSFDFRTDANRVEGFSTNTNERQQRLQEALSLNSASGALDQQALSNYFIGGGPFEQGYAWNSGNPIYGNFAEQPTGPAFNLVNNGLQGEHLNSFYRQALAERQLQGVGQNLAQQQAFDRAGLQYGLGAQGTQDALRRQTLGAFGGNIELNDQLTGQLGDFFSSGGAPSEQQRQAIAGIYDPLRQQGYSDLNQQYQNSLRQASDQFSARGLRNSDSPAQELTGRTIDEFGRQAQNFESGISSQQAQALLQQPYQQANLAGQLQGQSQNQFLNLINQYSQPINQGFNSGQSLQNQNQFGLQYTPASQSGPALQNMQALISGTNPAPSQPTFTGGYNIAQNPTFLQTFGQSYAGSLGQAGGQATAAGIGASHPALKEDIRHYEDEEGLEAFRAMPVYKWRYIGDNEEYIGSMTTDMPDDVIAGDKEERLAYNMVSYLGMLTAAIRALDAEVTALKEGA